MSVGAGKGATVKDINEGRMLDEKSSESPMIEIKKEPIVVDLSEQESPNKQTPKRKCVGRLKAGIFAEEDEEDDPKPKRKYVRKSKIESPINIPNTSVSSTINHSVELLHFSNNADSSMEQSNTIGNHKTKGKKTWSRRKKVNTDNLGGNHSKTTEEDSQSSLQIPPSATINTTPANSTQTPELSAADLTHSAKLIVEVKQKGRKKKIIQAVILDTRPKSLPPAPVSSEIAAAFPECQGQSVPNALITSQDPVPTPTALHQNQTSTTAAKISNMVKLENWKPKRSTQQRGTKLLLFSEMPEMPLDDKQRKEVNNRNKKKSKEVELVEVKKEIDEVDKSSHVSISETPASEDKEKKINSGRKKRLSNKVAVKLEVDEDEQSEVQKMAMDSEKEAKVGRGRKKRGQTEVKEEIEKVETPKIPEMSGNDEKEGKMVKVEKAAEEVGKTELLLPSEISDLPIADENEKSLVETSLEKERSEIEIKKEETVVEVEMILSRRMSHQASDCANVNSGASEIDGDDLDSQLFGNESCSEPNQPNVPLSPAVERNVVSAIDEVAKGDGEINPNPVAFPRRLSTRTRTARRNYFTPTHSPVKRRTSKRKSSQEFLSLINIEANERVATFEDFDNENCCLPSVTDADAGDHRDLRDSSHDSTDEEDELPIIYNADTCSVCRWKIRPDLDNLDVDLEMPRRKNHKFSYTADEKNELYADGQFLMDEYVLEKNREDAVLWRVIDSCKSVQRFDPYEANGRVFHHGTDHVISKHLYVVMVLCEKYHYYLEKDWEFYQRFQPVYAVPILENDDYQMALYVSVERLPPCLAMISKTDELFDAYKVVIQMIISANLERNFIQNQLRGEEGDIYFSANWEKIATVINCRVKEIMNAEYWAPNTFNILATFPRLIYSRIVSEEKSACTTCLNRDRKAVFTIKINGTPYNEETFEALPAPGIPNCQICYYCQPLIKSFIRLYHYRYLLFGCVQKNISHLLSDLEENEKCDSFQLLENMMEDHEWILHMFLEFQVVLAEADKSISQIVADPNKPARRYGRKGKK